MNGKTAKLLRRYSRFTGKQESALKRNWQTLDARQRFALRQEILSALVKKKK